MGIFFSHRRSLIEYILVDLPQPFGSHIFDEVSHRCTTPTKELFLSHRRPHWATYSYFYRFFWSAVRTCISFLLLWVLSLRSHIQQYFLRQPMLHTHYLDIFLSFSPRPPIAHKSLFLRYFLRIYWIFSQISQDSVITQKTLFQELNRYFSKDFLLYQRREKQQIAQNNVFPRISQFHGKRTYFYDKTPTKERFLDDTPAYWFFFWAGHLGV